MARDPIPTWFFALVVVREGDRFLVVQEADHGQQWYLPGGRVEPGESLGVAARRETFEEAGIPIVIQGILRLEHTPITDGGARFRIFFLARPAGATPPKSVPDEESLGAKWVTLEEAKALPWRNDEVLEIFQAVAADAPIYPLRLLGSEDPALWGEVRRGSPASTRVQVHQDRDDATAQGQSEARHEEAPAERVAPIPETPRGELDRGTEEETEVGPASSHDGVRDERHERSPEQEHAEGRKDAVVDEREPEPGLDRGRVDGVGSPLSHHLEAPRRSTARASAALVPATLVVARQTVDAGARVGVGLAGLVAERAARDSRSGALDESLGRRLARSRLARGLALGLGETHAQRSIALVAVASRAPASFAPRIVMPRS